MTHDHNDDEENEIKAYLERRGRMKPPVRWFEYSANYRGIRDQMRAQRLGLA